MPEPRFDPGGFYEFNLAEGAVRTRHGDRVVVLSDTVLGPLVAGAVRNGDLTAIRTLGRDVGSHVRESLGGSPAEAPPETVLGHAASILSLFGWGRLGFEQWGDALVATLSHAPVLDEQQQAVAALLGSMFSRLIDHDVACVPVADGKFLVLNPGVAEQVWAWVVQGRDLPAIVGRLQGAGA